MAVAGVVAVAATLDVGVDLGDAMGLFDIATLAGEEFDADLKVDARVGLVASGRLVVLFAELTPEVVLGRVVPMLMPREDWVVGELELVDFTKLLSRCDRFTTFARAVDAVEVLEPVLGLAADMVAVDVAVVLLPAGALDLVTTFADETGCFDRDEDCAAATFFRTRLPEDDETPDEVEVDDSIELVSVSN